jgi:hypothetical protein
MHAQQHMHAQRQMPQLPQQNQLPQMQHNRTQNGMQNGMQNGYGQQQTYLQQPTRPQHNQYAKAGMRTGYNDGYSSGYGAKSFASRDVQELAALLRSSNGSAPLHQLERRWPGQVKLMVESRPDILSLRGDQVFVSGGDAQLVPEIFEVTTPFEPQNCEYGELPLALGELVTVSVQHDSGWWRGSKVKSAAQSSAGPGWFPSGMVTPLCGTTRPSGSGRVAFFDVAASRIVRFNPKASRSEVDLAGVQPPLRDDDMRTFAQWFAPRLASQRGRGTVNLDVSRNAIGQAGVKAVLDLLHANEIAIETLDLSCNQLDDAGVDCLCSYLKDTRQPMLRTVNLRENNLQAGGSIKRLLEVLSHSSSAPPSTPRPEGGAEYLRWLEAECGVRCLVEADLVTRPLR